MTQKTKILVCDDEEGVRESLKLILSYGYDVILAKNSDDALGAIKHYPDLKLMLLDIKMPDKNGFELLKEVKAHNPEIPVIVVTGYQSVETAAEAIRFGAADYIVKPLDSKHVLETVEKILS